MRRRLCLVVSLTAAAGCARAEGVSLGRAVVDTLPGGTVRVTSASPTRWRDSARGWQVVEELRVQGAPGTDAELINPQSLALDGEGRLWIVDQKPARLKVYDRQGALVRTVGGEGEGPGEFRAGFIAVAGDLVVLHDPQVARTTIYDTAGRFVRSWPSACCYWTPIFVDNARRIYVPGMPRGFDGGQGVPWIRWSVDGAPLDTLYAPAPRDLKHWMVQTSGRNRMMFSMPVPYASRLMVTVDRAGGFVAGLTGEYRLHEIPNGRDTVRMFGRDWTPVPVTDQMRQDTIEAMVRSQVARMVPEAALRGAFHPSDVPATRPAFESIAVDEDGFRWIGLGGAVYDVFDSGDAWLGTLRLPHQFPPWQAYFGRGRIAAFLEDEGGTPMAVVMRLERGG